LPSSTDGFTEASEVSSGKAARRDDRLAAVEALLAVLVVVGHRVRVDVALLHQVGVPGQGFQQARRLVLVDQLAVGVQAPVVGDVEQLGDVRGGVADQVVECPDAVVGAGELGAEGG